jgi:ADP-glucose pyrophosphorylase
MVSRFQAVATQLKVRLLTPSEDRNRVCHFIACVHDMIDHALQNVSNSDIVGIIIQNQVNRNVKAIGTRVRWKHQFSRDILCSVFEEVSCSNTRYALWTRRLFPCNLSICQ